MGTIDVLGGIAGAFAAAIALLQRRRGGTRRFVKTSLAAAGQLLQCPFMYDHAGRAPFDEPSGREVLGDGPFYRCYRAADGWLFLALPASRTEALQQIEGCENIAGLDTATQIERLAETIAGKPIVAWREAFAGLGGCAVALGSLQALRERYVFDRGDAGPMQRTFRFVRDRAHPCTRGVTLVDWAGIRLRDGALLPGTPAPKYGANTRAILGELGYREREIDALFETGAVSDSWSKDYMPT